LRCLECAKSPCVDYCPVGVKVKDFVKLIVAGDYLGAAAKIREDNVLPAITGRVCPQEDHCEGFCLLHKKWIPWGSGTWSGLWRTTSRKRSATGSECGAHGQKGGDCGKRAGGIERGGRFDPERPPGTRVRGAA